jgi:hypothetical protein
MAVAGIAPVPKFQSYVVDPDMPVERSVKVTLDPLHKVVLLAAKFASKAHPSRPIGKSLLVPEHPVAKLSVTLILPLTAPKLTVILLLFGPVAPEVIVDPVGTDHT